MSGVGREPKADFFERLIDRALGVEVGIAPRLRSLFEPEPQTAVGPSLPAEPEDDAPGAAATVHRAHQAPQPTAQRRTMEPDQRDIAAQPAGNEPAPTVAAHRTVLVDAPIGDP